MLNLLPTFAACVLVRELGIGVVPLQTAGKLVLDPVGSFNPVQELIIF